MSESLGGTSCSDGFIACDVPCQRCGYNLRGLRREGRCPECGGPVKVSLLGERLRFADPIWLKKVSLGAKMPSYSLRAVVFAFLIAQSIRLVLGLFTGGFAWKWDSNAGLLLLLVVGYAMLSYGLWLIATPNAVMLANEDSYAPRRILRMSVLIAAFGLVISILFASGIRSAAWVPIALSISPLGAVSLLVAWGVCRYVQQLADRLPDDFTRRKSESYFVGYVVSWLLFAGAGTLGICTYGLPAGLNAFLPGLACVVAFGVLCLALPSYLMKSLESEIKKAQDLWNEAGEGADGASAN